MLKVQNISFSYNEQKTINEVSFELQSGKNLAVIGESGCGKSTLLKLIYGLYDLDSGEIYWNNELVLGPKFHLIPGMEYMKYLAQDFDLMPFISVAENVGKYLSNTNSKKKKARIAELLTLVEMADFSEVKAQYLSGGQMQRVALARVLASEPELLLLDEPFSHIDNSRRNSLRRNLFSYLREKKISVIVATHDSSDVLSFSDEVIVLKDGNKIMQANPESVYNNSNNHYIASLFGDVNEITIEGKTQFKYPSQLEQIEDSKFKVIVKQSFFKGSHYLIESEFQNRKIYFESKVSISMDTYVYLIVKV
jgi:ABC-type sulfate/molybdate transport systems ATPase subunit